MLNQNSDAVSAIMKSVASARGLVPGLGDRGPGMVYGQQWFLMRGGLKISNTPHGVITDSSKCQLNPETSAQSSSAAV